MPIKADIWRSLPILAALLAVWGASIAVALAERSLTIERAASQLNATVITLADFHELAEQARGDPSIASSERRTAAIWRALLQYPAAGIWLESNGEVIAGQPSLDAGGGPAIVVREDRETFSVLATVPESEVLVDWRQSQWQRAGILFVASVGFLLLTLFLNRALRQRAAAQQEVLLARERATQFASHRAALEATVAQRTAELEHSNGRLERELVDRKIAERQLKEHDALLHAVAKGAAELLESPSHDEAIAAVLELIGQTVGVSRVQINQTATDREGHLRSSIRYEWCAPGMAAMIDHPELQDLDLTAALPRSVAPLLVGGIGTFFVDDLSGQFKSLFKKAGMHSFLQIPVLVEGKLWGSFDFVDSSDVKRQWTWAETDTLQTLAGLIGAAITRARYVKELADANMIVQNSPTILYRVRGEPPFPLIYVSHNITKFGHDANELVGQPDWAQALMDPEDHGKLLTAMGRTLEKEATSASIEFRLRTGDGSHRWVENRYTPVRDKHGRLVEIEGIIIDITERKSAEEKIALLARTDPLTGLANRATFVERIRQAFAATKRGATPFAILYLDLDHFKAVNDTLGHATGDALLREVADRLRSCTRENDVVARLGGDEFAVLQTDMNDPAGAGALAGIIQTSLARPYQIDGNDLHVTASIGISPYAQGSASPEQMLAQADLALYRSKEEGRNRYRFHSDDLDQQVLERSTLAEDLRRAIEDDQLELHYQPQVELASGRIVSMEALVRWHHPVRGLLAASAFIPVAEKTGAIIAVGQWVLDRACRQMRQWRDEGIDLEAITLNVSLAQLKNKRELLDDVIGAIDKWGLAPPDLSFDVTEATLAQITIMRNDVLAELRALGVRIAIDDFGSEYSSFDYLRTYRVNHLKLSQSFIDEADHDVECAATVRAIISLACELGIGVVTAGVETEKQRDRLGAKATRAQGFYFSDPLDANRASELLRRGTIEPGAAAEDTAPAKRVANGTRKRTGK